jgi:hypothetical protein
MLYFLFWRRCVPKSDCAVLRSAGQRPIVRQQCERVITPGEYAVLAFAGRSHSTTGLSDLAGSARVWPSGTTTGRCQRDAFVFPTRGRKQRPTAISNRVPALRPESSVQRAQVPSRSRPSSWGISRVAAPWQIIRRLCHPQFDAATRSGAARTTCLPIPERARARPIVCYDVLSETRQSVIDPEAKGCSRYFGDVTNV